MVLVSMFDFVVVSNFVRLMVLVEKFVKCSGLGKQVSLYGGLVVVLSKFVLRFVVSKFVCVVVLVRS